MRFINPRVIATGFLSLALAIASQAVFAVSVKQQNLIDLIESKILFNKETIDDWIYKNQVMAINCNKEGIEVRTYE